MVLCQFFIMTGCIIPAGALCFVKVKVYGYAEALRNGVLHTPGMSGFTACAVRPPAEEVT
jgi:hypothetical protein